MARMSRTLAVVSAPGRSISASAGVLTLLAWAGVVLIVVGCSPPEPCYGLEKGHQYDIEIIEEVPPVDIPGGNLDYPPCTGLFDIHPGTVIRVRVDWQYDPGPRRDCLESRARVVAGLAPTGAESEGGLVYNYPVLNAGGPLAVGDCHGEYGLSLSTRPGATDPFAAPSASAPYPTLLMVSAGFDEQRCWNLVGPKDACYNTYGAKFSKVASP